MDQEQTDSGRVVALASREEEQPLFSYWVRKRMAEEQAAGTERIEHAQAS